jgi:hypothetical protein
LECESVVAIAVNHLGVVKVGNSLIVIIKQFMNMSVQEQRRLVFLYERAVDAKSPVTPVFLIVYKTRWGMGNHPVHPPFSPECKFEFPDKGGHFTLGELIFIAIIPAAS